MQNIQKYLKQIQRANFMTRTLNNPVRRKIISQLQSEGEVPVHKLVSKQKQEQPIVSQHLGILRDAQLVTTRRDGKLIYYSLNKVNLGQLLREIQIITNIGG